MTQLKSIRVQQMTDLIYKQGQAGVTKASVSLVFNNSDQSLSPQGYEHCKMLTVVRQILANGQTRYLLNDQVAKQKSIKQLFHSIGLNINNPNFLIQQGRIGQILAARPVELLSILEETAGTSMYDANRKDAMKIFEQKQLRLNQIRKTIDEEIQPRIQRLDAERKIGVQIVSLQKALKSIEIISGLAQIAHQIDQVEKLASKKAEIEKREAKLRSEYLNVEQQLVCKNEELQSLQQQILQLDSKYQEQVKILKQQLEGLQTQLAVFYNQQSNIDGKMKENDQNIKKKNQQIIKLTQKRQQLSQDIQNAQKSGDQQKLQQFQNELAALNQQKQRLESELDIIKTGTVDVSYFEQFQIQKEIIDHLKKQVFNEGEYLSINEIFSRLQQLSIVQDGEIKQLVQDITQRKQSIAKITQEIQDSLSTDQELLIQQDRSVKYLHQLVQPISEQQNIQFNIGQVDDFIKQLKSLIQSKRDQLKNFHANQSNSQKQKNQVIDQQYQQFISACQQNRGGAAIYSMMRGMSQNIKQKYNIHCCVIDALQINQQNVSSFIQETKVSFDTLLEVADKAAGMRLFNIISDYAESSSQFLRSNDCTSRVTIMPIDNVKGFQPNKQKLNVLHKYGGILLSEIIEPVNPDYSDIFNNLFGNIAIAPNLDSAKNVAYSKDCGIRCFTFDGDVVDPFGVVSGGSQKSVKTNIISEFIKLKQIQQQQVDRRKSMQIDFDEGYIENLSNSLQNIIKVKSQLDLINQQISMSGTSQNVQRKLSDNQKQLAQQEEQLQVEQSLQQGLNQILGFVQEAIQANSSRQQSEQSIKQQHQQCTNQVTIVQQNIDKLKKNSQLNDIEAKQMEIFALDQELQTHEFAKQQYEEQNKDLVDIDKKKTNDQIIAAQSAIKEVESKIFSIQVDQNSQTKEIQQIQNDISSLEAQFSTLKQKFQQTGSQLKESISNYNQQESILFQQVDQQNDCLNIFEQIYANKSVYLQQLKIKRKSQQLSIRFLLQSMIDGSLVRIDSIISLSDIKCVECVVEYLQQFDLKKEQESKTQELASIQNQTHTFSSTTANLEELQKNARNLISMEEKLQADRDKILDMIQKVDDKKSKALEELFTDVNTNLGNIFSILLPGAFAQLEKIDKSSIEKGVQFYVKLGETKTNLSGLSGGQKSLLALGFTLSLLKCRPSPIYILDEIDAALDLSHTHHIGQLISQQFKDSQFIIVSLKEGMFNHANRLFRVKFVDGMSKVYQEKV